MPEPAEIFAAELQKIEADLLKKLPSILSGIDKLSDAEIRQLARELDFYSAIVDSPQYSKALKGLITAYKETTDGVIAEAVKRGVVVDAAIIEDLNVLMELDLKTVLGRARTYADELQSEMFRHIVSGDSPADIVSAVAANTSLAPYQANVAVGDALSRFDRASHFKIFEDVKDVRYTYVGPLDDRTRDECRQTIENEPEGGYTPEGLLGAPVDPVDGGGFNCRHHWRVV